MQAISRILPPDLRQFVDDALTAGRYQNEAQLMTDAVRLLRQREANLDCFRASVQRGIADIERGEFDEVDDFDRYFDEIVNEVDQEGAAR